MLQNVSNCHKSESSRNKNNLPYVIVVLVIICGLPGLVWSFLGEKLRFLLFMFAERCFYYSCLLNVAERCWTKQSNLCAALNVSLGYLCTDNDIFIQTDHEFLCTCVINSVLCLYATCLAFHKSPPIVLSSAETLFPGNIFGILY